MDENSLNTRMMVIYKFEANNGSPPGTYTFSYMITVAREGEEEKPEDARGRLDYITLRQEIARMISGEKRPDFLKLSFGGAYFSKSEIEGLEKLVGCSLGHEPAKLPKE